MTDQMPFAALPGAAARLQRIRALLRQQGELIDELEAALDANDVSLVWEIARSIVAIEKKVKAGAA